MEEAIRDIFGSRTEGAGIVEFAREGEPFAILDPPPIFDAAAVVVDLTEGIEVRSVHPTIDVINADLPAGAPAVQGDLFRVAGVEYEVVDPRPHAGGLSHVYKLVEI